MRKRKLGNTDLLVSEIGLGCMSLGTDKKQAETIISAAIDEGINYFDTADLYDFGINEEIAGHALKKVRDQVVIATKAGNRWNESKDSWHWDASPSYLKSAVKDSLKRLGTDYIDLYQLHGGTMEDDIDGVIGAFEELKAEGLIRHYGISSIRPNVIRQYAEKSSISSVMMQYSLLDRRPEEWMNLLIDNGISMIARGPVAKGLLSDKMLDKASSSVKENGYLDYSYEELKDILPGIKEKLSPRNLNETALQYVLSHKAVASVIPGASTVEQLQQNCRAARAQSLTEEEIVLLKELTKSSKYEAHRDM
ncbi:aldo/keto reductase [Bacillus sp. MUM 13]|uniref:aldo/keto reductase n=1 Tax=Bacillus sp. MUM 13 TaxID=1678001 RepID=UPI0008F5F816|nr:aldo/keto reductase [Bacillus sp. MUM 13]OIK13641.1 oxidoreductase [Bacillus sp. MUM 13]